MEMKLKSRDLMKQDKIKGIVFDSLFIFGLCMIVVYFVYILLNFNITSAVLSFLLGLGLSSFFYMITDDLGPKFMRFSYLRNTLSIFIVVYTICQMNPEAFNIKAEEQLNMNVFLFISPIALYLLIVWTIWFFLSVWEEKFYDRFNNEKYITNIYSKTKSTDEILLVNNYVISKIIKNMGRECYFPYVVHKKLIKEMRNLKYNIKYILMLENQQVQSQASTAAAALLKIDYLAYLNFLKLVKKYDYSDYEIFTVSELQILVDRTTAMNSDLTNLIEAIEIKVEKDRLDKQNEYKENAKREVSNTFKMLG